MQNLKDPWSYYKFTDYVQVLQFDVVGSEKPELPIDVKVRFLDHHGKEVGSYMGNIGNRELNTTLSGGGYRDTVIKNPFPIADILEWTLIINWDGKEEIIDLGLTSE